MESKNKAYELKLDAGFITVPILDVNDGKKLGSFKFNPNDLDIARRYEKAAAKLESITIPEDAGEETIFEVSDKIKEQMDYLLNCNVSDDIFAICNPLTLTSDGDFFVEKVIDGIAGLIEQTMDVRLKKKKAKIKKPHLLITNECMGTPHLVMCRWGAMDYTDRLSCNH